MMEVGMARRHRGPGYSVPEAAEALNISYKVLRAAIRRGEAHVVPFGGLDRMTAAEVNRLRELFGEVDQAA
jgi:hypothetical protein